MLVSDIDDTVFGFHMNKSVFYFTHLLNAADVLYLTVLYCTVLYSTLLYSTLHVLYSAMLRCLVINTHFVSLIVKGCIRIMP